MVNIYLSTKFPINSIDGFQEKEFYGRRTDGGRMTDSRCTSIDSCDATIKLV